jgi:AbrB family looped-hinge helix DNA binding protein
MVAKLTLDKAGRVVLPKSLRDELRLNSSSGLELRDPGPEGKKRPSI